jgi:hypothetical protein
VNVNPLSLNLEGGTQPEIFRRRVDAIVHELSADAAQFWQEALARDGPIAIWVINGERRLFNGHQRYHGAMQAGVDIPASHIFIVDEKGSTIPTWRFDRMTWLPGFIGWWRFSKCRRIGFLYLGLSPLRTEGTLARERMGLFFPRSGVRSHERNGW